MSFFMLQVFKKEQKSAKERHFERILMMMMKSTYIIIFIIFSCRVLGSNESGELKNAQKTTKNVGKSTVRLTGIADNPQPTMKIPGLRTCGTAIFKRMK